MTELGRRGRKAVRAVREAPGPAAVGLFVLPVAHALLRTNTISHRGLIRRLPLPERSGSPEHAGSPEQPGAADAADTAAAVDATRETAPTEQQRQTARSIAEGVGLGASVWRLRRTSCLARSTLTWWLCRRRGIGADLRFGMSADGSRTGHAWVEVDGLVLDDAPDVASRYVAFDGGEKHLAP